MEKETSTVDLAAYLQRIGFQGRPRADVATLKQMHRQHLLAIPYENLDVQLQRRSISISAGSMEKSLSKSAAAGVTK